MRRRISSCRSSGDSRLRRGTASGSARTGASGVRGPRANRVLRSGRRDVGRDARLDQRVELLAVQRGRLDVAGLELVDGVGLAVLAAARLAVERLADSQPD